MSRPGHRARFVRSPRRNLIARTSTTSARTAAKCGTEKAAQGATKKGATTKAASSTKPASTNGTSSRSGADWDAAKDILAAHRTLARAEKRESDLASNLEAHTKTLKTLDKQFAALTKALSAASEDLKTATSKRKKGAKKLHKLESATPMGTK